MLNDDEEAALKAELLQFKVRIKEVSDEAKGHRLNAAEARKAAEAADAARAEAETAAAARIKQVETESGERLSKAQQTALRANLRAAAREAGAVDPADMLALIAADKIKVDDEGDITNAAELLAELKTSKPYLFGGSSTSSTEKAPPAKPVTPKSATEMTSEEYAAARAVVTGVRR